jgi:D-glycero-D-manno-heptose 1,7-bisphosphate phosphatase
LTNAAVFFDRDGTLMEEAGYCSDPRDVHVYPGVPEALVRLREAGFRLVVVTNQNGIARGFLTEEQYRAVEAEFLRQLAPAWLDATYFCPDPPGSPRRKPEPAMVLEAAADLGIDLAASYFVGDKASDIECGRRAGTRTIQVQTGYGLQHADCGADFTVADAVAAVELILAGQASR